MADFVILDQDPTRIHPDDILKIKVLQTWMDGKITHNIWVDNNV
jgi:predicted amidohydrolase YtcJ